MEKLTPELIKELIPSLLVRVEFKKKWLAHFQVVDNGESSSSINDPPNQEPVKMDVSKKFKIIFYTIIFIDIFLINNN